MSDDISGAASKRRADSVQLARQWAILRLLADSHQSFSVKQLADQLNSSKSTIQRDLATLETQFALIAEEAGKQKKAYRIDQKIRALETVTFGCLELLAVHAAASMTSSLKNTPIGEQLASVKAKLRGFLSARHNGGLAAMTQVFVDHARGYVDYAGHDDMIADITDAIARRRVCVAMYHAAWKDTRREHKFKPLRLVWHKSALYLLCLFDGKKDMTTLAVHRLMSLHVTSETFAPPRVNVDEHVGKAFGIFVSEDEENVEIEFDESIAWRIEERVFHPDEQKERLEDGRLRYRLRTSAQWEVIPWVMRFGALAELKHPTAWRDSIRDSLQGMTERYSS